MIECPQSACRLLSDLVAHPSVCGRPNDDIICYIQNYLAQHGVAARRIFDATGTKSSLLATIGPSDRPGVVLSGHTDVVPVDGQDWTTPPFTASLRDGRIFGRGTTDMKGFLACVLARVPDFVRLATQVPVHLAFSYDEELGCRGAPDLVHAVSQLECRPALCIVGEPTGLRIVRAHKGKLAFRVEVRGRGGHSAAPHLGVNAVRVATLIAGRLNALEEETERTGLRDPAFEPPQTTVHIGSLHGGGALNIVPDHAVLEFEIRYIPNVDADELLDDTLQWIGRLRSQLQERAPEADIRIERIAAYPPLGMASSDGMVDVCSGVLGCEAVKEAVSFGTEAGIYATANIPTIVCGPGDIGRAHKANEWIGLDELSAADRLMARLAARLGQPLEEWALAASG